MANLVDVIKDKQLAKLIIKDKQREYDYNIEYMTIDQICKHYGIDKSASKTYVYVRALHKGWQWDNTRSMYHRKIIDKSEQL